MVFQHLLPLIRIMILLLLLLLLLLLQGDLGEVP